MRIRIFTLPCILLGSGLISGMLPKLQAQIAGNIEADIPFSFVAGDTTFRPGSYVIHPLGGEDPAVEIRRTDDPKGVSVLITRTVGASVPAKTELIFVRYGDREFLSKILVEGNEEKAEIERSRAELALRREGQKAEVHSHPARYRKAPLSQS